MRLGLVPPIVHRNPRFAPPAWEAGATFTDLADVVKAADRAGYDFVCVPGHVAIPESVGDVRGTVYWDQVATMGGLAAVTDRIGLCAYIVVLAYHHPLEIAKAFGTIDRMSGGRVILGVGVGTLREEFDLLGRPFADRGARADDALRAVRAAWGKRLPSYEGEHYAFDGFVVEPHAVRETVPIWVGGRTSRSLRRALELGDGWAPFRLLPDELRPMLDVHRDALEARAGFDLVFPPEPPLDPAGDPAGARAVVEAYRALGATGLTLRFRHTSKRHYVEQLDAMVALTR